VKFWDSSALVPLCVEEPSTQAVTHLFSSDPQAAVWWATPVECASALARLERDGSMTDAAATEAFARLAALSAAWIVVEPLDEIREIAQRLLRMHPLRAADALQIAAAWLAAERRPASLTLVTLDERVATAARKEGFQVSVPA